MSGKTAALSDLPSAQPAECPVEYADRLARWYGSRIDDDHRRLHGYYLTPVGVAKFMADLSLCEYQSVVRVVDPAAGTGILAAATCSEFANRENKPSRIQLTCYELDSDLRPALRALLAHLTRWLARRRVKLDYRVEWRDFVLTNAGALEGGILPSGEPKYDVVIANPPYFKVSKSDPRAQAASWVVKGQPNIYGLFMAVSAALLREGGSFTFITPRSFASGPYFQRFRDVFFSLIKPTHIHVFNSRTEAFDEVLQETLITAGKRETLWGRKEKAASVNISSSGGAADINDRFTRELPLTQVLRHDRTQQILHLPADEQDDHVRKIVGEWTGSLHAYGWEVSTGPVVAFRAREFLRDKCDRNVAPLLWLQHVKPMALAWPLNVSKREFIADNVASRKLLLPNKNYVVLRRFSAKEERRRLTAAPYLAKRFNYPRVGLENHLNYIWRRDGLLSEAEVFGLAALLNSALLDRYIRVSSGNTQVSATELRAMPLPAREVIKRIGKRAARCTESHEQIVAEELGHGK